MSKEQINREPSSSHRSAFEKWISRPPYERDLDRWPMDETKHAWPGQYLDDAVQIAWEAWQEASGVNALVHIDGGHVDPAMQETLDRMAALLRAKELIRTGNAAVDKNGRVVDRHANHEAVPILPHNQKAPK